MAYALVDDITGDRLLVHGDRAVVEADAVSEQHRVIEVPDNELPDRAGSQETPR